MLLAFRIDQLETEDDIGQLPRLRQQVRCWRKVLEQRQMRRDLFPAPQPRPFREGHIERRNPERTHNSARERRAIG